MGLKPTAKFKTPLTRRELSSYFTSVSSGWMERAPARVGHGRDFALSRHQRSAYRGGRKLGPRILPRQPIAQQGRRLNVTVRGASGVHYVFREVNAGGRQVGVNVLLNLGSPIPRPGFSEVLIVDADPIAVTDRE